MLNKIVSSSKNENEEVSVFFGNENTNDAYYTHGITSLGRESDDPSGMNTAWAWVNHMRSKGWWNSSLEDSFFEEVSKHFESL